VVAAIVEETVAVVDAIAGAEALGTGVADNASVSD
jgi:hypothetical protein